MKKSKWNSDWVAPIFVVLAILSIWLSLTYLPLSTWGINFDTSLLWTFAPWLMVFALAMFALKELIKR